MLYNQITIDYKGGGMGGGGGGGGEVVENHGVFDYVMFGWPLIDFINI